MSKCVRCKLEILDDAVMCPLCHGVLLNDNISDNAVNNIKETGRNYEYGSLIYPNIELAMKKTRILTRASVFFSIIAELVCILINYLTFNRVRWSIVTAVAFTYFCFTLIYSVKQNKSHQRKMIVQLILGIFMVVAIDASLGYIGWSLSYVIPGAIVLMDLGIAILMIINRRNWQNYLMAQIWMFIVSVVCMIPIVLMSDTFPLFGVIAVLASLLCLAISFVFGDKTAENEFRRRFHI